MRGGKSEPEVMKDGREGQHRRHEAARQRAGRAPSARRRCATGRAVPCCCPPSPGSRAASLLFQLRFSLVADARAVNTSDA